jgi:hypothetical protein
MESEITHLTRMAVQSYYSDRAKMAIALEKVTRLRAAKRLIDCFKTRLVLELFDDVD